MAESRYSAHVSLRQRITEGALAESGFDGLVLQSGAPFTYFADDQDAPFRTTPHFAHWTPLEGPQHLLHVRHGERPRLVRVAPEDYWYEQAPLGDPFWAGEFEIVEVAAVDKAWAQLELRGRTAYIGDQGFQAAAHGLPAAVHNPEPLVKRLDWARSFKSAYEVECIEAAERTATQGHVAARVAFLDGGSELDIHHAFLRAAGCTERDLPYESIVALNEKAATLHYCGKRDVRDGKVLLIDVGTRHLGYASDITRTWCSQRADAEFRALVEGLDRVQQELCALVKPKLPYLELHRTAHVKIADLLQAAGILSKGGAEAVGLGLTAPFLPHGLGHFLGLQVHDVAGRQKAPEGGNLPPPPEFPFLRTTRTIERDQVFTIEPGIYFIEMLLREHRTGPNKALFDWKRIDRLVSHGGIRIEDDVLVTADGHRNLTRPLI